MTNSIGQRIRGFRLNGHRGHISLLGKDTETSLFRLDISNLPPASKRRVLEDLDRDHIFLIRREMDIKEIFGGECNITHGEIISKEGVFLGRVIHKGYQHSGNPGFLLIAIYERT